MFQNETKRINPFNIVSGAHVTSILIHPFLCKFNRKQRFVIKKTNKTKLVLIDLKEKKNTLNCKHVEAQKTL